MNSKKPLITKLFRVSGLLLMSFILLQINISNKTAFAQQRDTETNSQSSTTIER